MCFEVCNKIGFFIDKVDTQLKVGKLSKHLLVSIIKGVRLIIRSIDLIRCARIPVNLPFTGHTAGLFVWCMTSGGKATPKAHK